MDVLTNKPPSFSSKYESETISRPIAATHGYLCNRSCSDRVDSDDLIQPLKQYSAVYQSLCHALEYPRVVWVVAPPFEFREQRQ